ncbi:MAG: GIY-YIG nuclease family protein [Verrucomicrobiota bacterium]|nr:GIY-YIG nuclease family protein [Verrucomicrobiota bacterium]
MEDLRNGLFKIGQSQTPEKREITLQSEVPEISLRFYIPAHDTAERELHDLFEEKRVRGEWFGLAPEDLLSVIEFLKQHGDLPRASVDYEWLGKISFGVFSSRS